MSQGFALIIDVIMFVLLLSLSLVCYRLIRGPSLPDRAVAGDQVSIHVVALIVVYSLKSQQPILIDLVIVTAVVGFLSVAVLGVYLERAARGHTSIEAKDLRKNPLRKEARPYDRR